MAVTSRAFPFAESGQGLLGFFLVHGSHKKLSKILDISSLIHIRSYKSFFHFLL